MLLGNPNSWDVIAESQGTILGSVFLHEFPPSPVAVIGPLTVHPSAEGGIGIKLMDAAVIQAHRQNHDQIRLVNRQVIFVPSYCIQSAGSLYVSLYF